MRTWLRQRCSNAPHSHFWDTWVLEFQFWDLQISNVSYVFRCIAFICWIYNTLVPVVLNTWVPSLSFWVSVPFLGHLNAFSAPILCTFVNELCNQINGLSGIIRWRINIISVCSFYFIQEKQLIISWIIYHFVSNWFLIH